MSLEKNIADYIRSKGINIAVMAEKTGIPYFSFYNSFFNKTRVRQLRGTELIAICAFLEKEPTDFIDDKVS